MTTPQTMSRIIRELRERLTEAQREAAESRRLSRNGYNARYDSGYVQALKDTIVGITGED